MIHPMTESGAAKGFAKVIIIGDSGTGKTGLMKQFCKSELRSSSRTRTRATVATDFIHKEVEVDGRAVSLQIWDTAGQERYISLGVAFYRGADACILAFDLTNLKSFQNLEKWRATFLKETGTTDEEAFPFVVTGNKLDLANQGQREVQESVARAWCANRGDIPYFETSKEEDINVERVFLTAARKVLDRKTETLKNENAQVVDMYSSQVNDRKCCVKS